MKILAVVAIALGLSACGAGVNISADPGGLNIRPANERVVYYREDYGWPYRRWHRRGWW